VAGSYEDSMSVQQPLAAHPVTLPDANSLFSAITITTTYAAAAFAAGDYEQVVRIADRPPGWRKIVALSSDHRDELLPYFGQHASFLVQVGLANLALGNRDEADAALGHAQELLDEIRGEVANFAYLSPCAKHSNMVPYGICREPPCD
jgi:hypothetical protein